MPGGWRTWESMLSALSREMEEAWKGESGNVGPCWARGDTRAGYLPLELAASPPLLGGSPAVESERDLRRHQHSVLRHDRAGLHTEGSASTRNAPHCVRQSVRGSRG